MNQLNIQSRREFDNIVDHMGQYIAQWIQGQLKSLRKNKKLLIQTGNNSYQLGNYRISQQDSGWVVIFDDKFVHSFMSMISAFLYCLHHRSNEIQSAEYLRVLDQSLCSLNNEKQRYLSRVRNVKISESQRQLNRARLSETQQRINMLSNQIQKILIAAKYKKIREIL